MVIDKWKSMSVYSDNMIIIVASSGKDKSFEFFMGGGKMTKYNVVLLTRYYVM